MEGGNAGADVGSLVVGREVGCVAYASHVE